MKKSRQLEASLYDLNTQLEPIKEEARVAKAEVQAREEQVRGLEEESRRWQERNQQLLSKYDRIDPADMQALKEQIEQLQKTVQELQAGNEEKDALLKEAEVKVRRRLRFAGVVLLLILVRWCRLIARGMLRCQSSTRTWNERRLLLRNGRE